MDRSDWVGMIGIVWLGLESQGWKRRLVVAVGRTWKMVLSVPSNLP